MMLPSLRLHLLSLALALIASAAPAQGTLGAFTAHADVGDVRHPGTVTYRPGTETYTVSGSGANMWFTEDELHLVYRRMTGDFILTAEAAFVGEGADPHRKYGWIVRDGLAPDAAYVDVAIHGDGLTSMQYRVSPGDTTYEATAELTAPDVFRLERRGGVYTMSVARRGEPFETVTLDTTLALGDEVLVGLFVCAHDPEALETANFWNVRVTVPAAPDLQPYRDYLGARVETVEVATGRRRVVLSSSDAVQAPNWLPDGNTLLVNANGRLYTLGVDSGALTEIPTDFATDNNNDHVLTFDGRTIGLSHSPSGQSVVYSVPVAGGTPVRISPEGGPSYLHGWSPGGDTVLYTAERGDGNYDIYAKSSTGDGPELRLTTADSLDDGPEYSPDGKWIYFNSSRSGLMQIWRMRPDGSDQRQVTRDTLNSWFAHPSPDGRWLVYIAYAEPIAPSDHPWYKRVYLMLMPAAGGEARVLAYVYGGQGTINVPSWSPDSRRVAFVSNTAVAE